jgi:hypothetical protein
VGHHLPFPCFTSLSLLFTLGFALLLMSPHLQELHIGLHETGIPTVKASAHPAIRSGRLVRVAVNEVVYRCVSIVVRERRECLFSKLALCSFGGELEEIPGAINALTSASCIPE